MILVDPPEAPFEIIYDADTSDTLLNITPPAGSQRMYLNAPGDKLDGWNKKKQTGSHTVWSTRNSDHDTGVVGTVRVLNEVSDGIYLTNVDGSKKGLHLLPDGISVDKTAHSITEEFVIQNDGAGTDVQVIDNCNDATGWTVVYGSNVAITTENGRLKVTGVTNSAGRLWITKSIPLDLANVPFIAFSMESVNTGQVIFYIWNGSNNKLWGLNTRYPISPNSPASYICAVQAPVGTVGATPTSITETPPTLSTIDRISVGVTETATEHTATFYVDDIYTCNGTWAQVEVAVPDFAMQTGSKYFDIYAHNGSAYEATPAFKSSEFLGTVYQANMKMLDGTSTGNMYAASGQYYRGVAVTNIGNRLESVGKTAPLYQDPNFITPITLSSNYGTLKRRVIAILMPPSDNGRTDLNKCRLQLKIYYDDENGNVVKDLSGCGNHGAIVGGVTKLNDGGLQFDGSTGYVNFGNNDVFDIGLSDFRVVIKIKTTDTDGYIINKYTGWAIRLASNAINVLLYYGSTLLSQTTVGATITDGVEHIIDWTLDRDGVSIIKVDGVSQAGSPSVTSFSNTDLQTTDPLVVGARSFDKSTLYAGDIKSATIYKDSVKVWEILPAVSNMGSTTFEFTPQSLDHFTGLDNVGNWIAFERPDKRAEVFLFSRKLASLAVTEDENGKLARIEVGLKKGTKVARSWVRYPDFDADGNSDDVPNFIDKIVEQLQNKFAFTRKYTNEVDLSGMAVIENDFSIDLQTANPVYPVSSGSKVYDSQGNLLTPVETITTADGNLDLVEVYGKSSIRVFGDENLNYGECKVWDTVTAGNNVENTWVRVYDVDHVFTGDLFVENGLIRVCCTLTRLRLYVNINGVYVQCDNTDITTTSLGLVEVSTDSATFNVNLYTVTLKKGLYSIVESGKIIFNNVIGTTRFAISEGSVYDVKVNPLEVSGYTTFGTNTKYCALIAVNTTRILILAAPTSTEGIKGWTSSVAKTIVSLEPVDSSGIQKIVKCAIPYSQQMYFEAEAGSRVGGTTLTADVDAYPFSGSSAVTLPAMNSQITFSTTLAAGSYTVFVRVKSPDTATPPILYLLKSGGTIRYITSSSSVASSYGYAVFNVVITASESSILTGLDVYNNVPLNKTLVVDYIVVIPTGLIETQAKRALVNLNEVKTYKEV